MWLAFLTLKNDHWKVTKNDCSWHYMFCGQILRLDRQIPCKKMAHISNYIHNCTVVAVTGNGSSLVQINLLLNIISFYSTEELLRHASVCFFCSTVLPNPFWGAVPWHWEVLAFCCPKFPKPLWPTAAKDCSSVHAGDQQSHPEWSTCQNPNAADCPQGKAQFFIWWIM